MIRQAETSPRRILVGLYWAVILVAIAVGSQRIGSSANTAQSNIGSAAGAPNVANADFSSTESIGDPNELEPHFGGTSGAALQVSNASAGVARAAPGTIDLSFGNRGMAVVHFPGQDFAWKVALQRDGKIVMAGYADRRLGVVRLTANGFPDPTFNRNGRTTIALGTSDFPMSVAVTPDGSIIVGAYVDAERRYTGNSDLDPYPQVALDGYRFALVKLRGDGSLDPSFGRGGIALSQQNMVRPLDDVAVNMALTPSGQIIVQTVRGFNVGYYGYPGTTVLMRFRRDGQLDPTFGVGGTAPTPYAGALPAPGGLAVQPDGRILAGMTLIEASLGWPFMETPADYLIARYLPTGVLDPTFGTGGVSRPEAPGLPDNSWGMKLQQDAKIVVFGQGGSDGFTASMVRLNSDGTVDSGFGHGGVATLAVGRASNFRGVAVQPDGAIVAAVNAYGTNGVARFRPDGSHDPSFGPNGYRQIPLKIISEVAIQLSRVIAIGGLTSDPDNGFAAVGLTR